MVEYNFAGNIKVTVEESRGVYKIDFDPGNVSFKITDIPMTDNLSYGEPLSHYIDKEYYGIPMIYQNYYNDMYWINMSCINAQHDSSIGKNYSFPLYTSKDFADKFVKSIGIIVKKFIEIGYIKEDKVKEMNKPEIITHTFGSLKVILDKRSNDTVYVKFEGLKSAEELPVEYANGYPSIVNDYDNDVVIRNTNGLYIHSNGNTSINKYFIIDACPKSMDTARKIVDTVASAVMRLNEIKEKEKKAMEEKKMVKDIVFNGLAEYVENVVYNIEGCIVTISKTDSPDTFEIEIDSGDYKFEAFGGCETYRPENPRIEKSLDSEDWWISGNDPWIADFYNGETFNVCEINTILKAIKNTVEFENKSKIPEVKLMTADEMKQMLKDGKLLPSEISKIKWERIKEYVKQNKLTSVRGEKVGIGSTNCALCEVYYHLGCDNCPLNKIGDRCNAYTSTYRNIWMANNSTSDLIDRIDYILYSLDEAITYEKSMVEKSDKIELKKETQTFNIHDILITTKYNGCDTWSISIDPNGYILDSNCNAYKDDYVIVDNSIAFWKTCSSGYTWFLHADWNPNEYAGGHKFNNGYTDTKEEITKMIEDIKFYIDYRYKNGKEYKKC